MVFLSPYITIDQYQRLAGAVQQLRNPVLSIIHQFVSPLFEVPAE